LFVRQIQGFDSVQERWSIGILPEGSEKTGFRKFFQLRVIPDFQMLRIFRGFPAFNEVKLKSRNKKNPTKK